MIIGRIVAISVICCTKDQNPIRIVQRDDRNQIIDKSKYLQSSENSTTDGLENENIQTAQFCLRSPASQREQWKNVPSNYCAVELQAHNDRRLFSSLRDCLGFRLKRKAIWKFDFFVIWAFELNKNWTLQLH